ncbi:MAG: hypothetical protein HW414_879 [Dehalococcoidia bacterium]|nr:hypothetical protein [Dehalococcoidia bacterium]
MTKKALSRGRGPRLREEEVERMVALYLEGKSYKAIGKEVGRHWQTVRKYAIRALQEREGRELRREALKEALVRHFEDLVGALTSIGDLLDTPKVDAREWESTQEGWRPATPGRRDGLLLQALRDSHAKESPLWSWWDSWKQSRESYDRALSPLRQRTASELAKLEKSQPGVSLTHELTLVVFCRAVSLCRGAPLYEPSMMQVLPAVEQDGKRDGEELWLGRSTLLAAGKGMDLLQKRAFKLFEDVRNWEEINELARLYRQMGETEGKIEEEVEVLSLRRAFPGRCRLCPV